MECGYDAGGLRLRRKITDNFEETEEERRFIYDQNDLLIAEYVWDGDSWELSREYVNDANGVVCTIDYDYRDWGGYELGWHLKDHLGSTVAVVAQPVLSVPPGVPLKPGQRILWTGSYESFGRPDNNVPVCPGAWDNPIQFTGYYSDGDVFEHYYARARYYDPYTGRFLSRDPADFEYDKVPIAINRYLYCGNYPLGYVDPSGRFFWALFLNPGIFSILFDIGTGALIGGISGAIQEGHTWFEGMMTGIFAGAVTGATSALHLCLAGVSSFADFGTLGWASIFGESTSIFGALAGSSVGIQGLTQSFLTAMHPNMNGSEGPWPLYGHHGAIGQLFSIGGSIFGAWGVGSSIMGLIATGEDFIQHVTQNFGIDKGPFNELFSQGWFSSHVLELLGGWAGLTILFGLTL
jgi:RHS repeat-associated protein